MTVTLSRAKADNIKYFCHDILTRTQPTNREVTVVMIGKLVAKII